MATRSKWIWLRFATEKDVQLEYIDARHFNTVQDILDRFRTSYILKLYDDSGRELKPQVPILPLREYTIKRHNVNNGNIMTSDYTV